MRATGKSIFNGRQLTIGLDLGDRWSFYCVVDEAGEIILHSSGPLLWFSVHFACELPRIR